MQGLTQTYTRMTRWLSGPLVEGLALLVTRVALAGVFWRSGRTKVEEGTWLDISDITYVIFENEFSGVPLPVDIAAPAATYAEFVFPILLVMGLATRFSAAALLIMTLVIQIFVFPDAWWQVHILWVAMTAILISRGAGVFSVDAMIARMTGTRVSASDGR